jgi:hypothetical protein
MKKNKEMNLNYIRYLSGVISEDVYYEMETGSPMGGEATEGLPYRLDKELYELFKKAIETLSYHAHDLASFDDKYAVHGPVAHSAGAPSEIAALLLDISHGRFGSSSAGYVRAGGFLSTDAGLRKYLQGIIQKNWSTDDRPGAKVNRDRLKEVINSIDTAREALRNAASKFVA